MSKLLEFTRAYARKEDFELNILIRIWIKCFENNKSWGLYLFCNTHTHTPRAREVWIRLVS